jgi:outer membrane protein OmpA-like peptidoglycan-associated protein
MRSPSSWIFASVLVLSAWAGANEARAQGMRDEPWYLTFDLGAAGPINDTPFQLFNLGGDTSVGVYRSLIPELAIGGRLRAGVLAEGGDLQGILPEDDPGVLDYQMISTGVRIRPFARVFEHHMYDQRRGAGLYIDLAPAAALLDGDFVPAYEAAVGYNIGAGPVTLGPSFRFTHFIETHGRFGGSDVLTWTGGLELTFLDHVRTRPEAAAERQVPRQAVATAQDRDGDWFLDDHDGCPDQAESWNGLDDADGCPDGGARQPSEDAVAIDERVFFDYDSAALRESGRAQLDAIAAHHREHGEHYQHLVIAGHTDTRGPAPYNDALSVKRAALVVTYLKEHGIPGTAIRLEGHGESDPAVANATTELDHQVNRRVEFRIEWRDGERPEGVQPFAEAMPDYVDEAPARVQARDARIARREARRQERELAALERRIGRGRATQQPSEPVASAESTGRGVDADERQAQLEPGR